MQQLIAERERGLPVGPVKAEGFNFLSPVLTNALSYWLSIKKDAAFPRRDAMAPEEIVALWPHLLMVDVIDGGADYYVRLFGQNLVDTYGEHTGRRLSEAKVPDLVRERSHLLFEFCRQNVAPTYSYWPETASDRRPFVNVEALCLPLSSDGVALDRMLALNVNTPSSR